MKRRPSLASKIILGSGTSPTSKMIVANGRESHGLREPPTLATGVLDNKVRVGDPVLLAPLR